MRVTTSIQHEPARDGLDGVINLFYIRRGPH